MLQKYTFSGDGTLEFDDSKSIRELIQYAFDEFDYYEPAGIELLTVFQSLHPKTHTGWFTLDTSRSCGEEILERDGLCFAYHMPNVFYYAEGGWGHHMEGLGNHPVIPDPVSLHLRFDGFDNTVVINGNYSLRDIIRFLKRTGYVLYDLNMLQIFAVGTGDRYFISFDDPIIDEKLLMLNYSIEPLFIKQYGSLDGIYYFVIDLSDDSEC